MGSPIAHYQVWNTGCGRPDTKRTRPPPEECPSRKTGVRGIPVEEDLPPEEYPSRKTGVRGIPVVEDLAQSREDLPPEEDP